MTRTGVYDTVLCIFQDILRDQSNGSQLDHTGDHLEVLKMDA